MADILSELFVKIGADIKGLEAGLKSADTRMGKFAGNIKKHHKAIGVAMTAVGAGILAVGILSTKTYAQMGDEVAKMAKRTGFSTEALSELRHAAELSGASLAGIEKASRTLSGAITDAGFGLETYVRAFDSIGLAYEDLAKLTPEEQFLKVMEALAGVEDETLRAATAADIMGRSGTAMLPMLADGAEGLKEMRQEAHDLHIVFTEETAKSAEEMTDAMHNMDSAMTGVKMAIGGMLAEALKPMIAEITKIISKISDWMKQHPELARLITIVAMVMGALLVVFGPLLIMLPGLAMAFSALGVAITIATGPVGLIIIAIAALIAIGILLWKNWDDISARAVKIWGGIVTYFQDIWQRISAIFSGIGEAMWRPIQVAVDAILKYINAIIEGIQRLWLFVARIMGWAAPKPEAGIAPTAAPALIGGGPAEYAPARFQKGGIVTKPTFGLIAEQRPEAIIPLPLRGLGEINITLSGIFMGNEADARKLATLIRKYLRQDERFLYGGVIA